MNELEAFNNFFKAKRDQYLVEIRKQKNGQHILAKRIKLAESVTPSKSKQGSVSSSIPSQSSLKIQKMMQDLSISFTNALESGDLDFLAEVAECLRKYISRSEAPPLLELINTRIVPQIIELLDPKFYHNEKLMYECSWIMTNIASGEQKYVQYLVDLDLIPKALNLFSHPSLQVKENALWILANIAGEDISYRDLLLERDIVMHVKNLLSGLDDTVEENFLVQIAWLISDLVRGNPYPEFEQIASFLPIIKYLFDNYSSREMLNYCLWSLSSISDGDICQIQEVLNLNCTKKILEMIDQDDMEITSSCLKIIGNLLTGCDKQNQILLEEGIIGALAPLLEHHNKIIRRDTVWAFSNILAGNHIQIDLVFKYNDGEIIEKLFNMIEVDDIGISKECIVCVTNACSAATIEQICVLVENNLLEILVKIIQNEDTKLIKVSLEALECLLSEAKKNSCLNGFDYNPFLIRLAECGGYNTIENLQNHRDDHVYKAVSRLIDNYFTYEV